MNREIKIKHIIIDLEEIDDPYPYDSDVHLMVKEIREQLEKLLIKLKEDI